MARQLKIEWDASAAGFTVTAATFEAPTGVGASWGIRRTDTEEEVVASGTALTVSGGRAYYYVTEPEKGLRYEYWIKATDGTNTIYMHLYVNGTPHSYDRTTLAGVLRRYILEGGRRDRVLDAENDDFTDNDRMSAVEIINDAQRWLDRQFRYHKSDAWLYKRVAQGGEIITFNLARYIEAVYVRDDDAANQTPSPDKLTKIDWWPHHVGLAPDQVDYATEEALETAEFGGDDLDVTDNRIVFTTTNLPLHAVRIAPDYDQANRSILIRAKWYNPRLDDDGDKSFWTVNDPDMLIRAAMMKDELFHRNRQGNADFREPLIVDLKKIQNQLVAEEANASNWRLI